MKRDAGANLSSLRVLNASGTQVVDAPAGIDAVDLQLRELKGGVEGLGADLNDNGVDGQRHPLYDFLCKPIFAGDAEGGDTAKLTGGTLHPPLSLLSRKVQFYHNSK